MALICCVNVALESRVTTFIDMSSVSSYVYKVQPLGHFFPQFLTLKHLYINKNVELNTNCHKNSDYATQTSIKNQISISSPLR